MITMDDIIREGHPTLRQVAEEVDLPLSEDERLLAHDMMEFLANSQDEETAEKYKLRPGVGIAAPQVDVSKRIIAVLIPGEETEENPNPEPQFQEILVNPRILSHSVAETCLSSGEGCLSVDRDVPGYVPRFARITLEYFTIEGEKKKRRLRGYPAIVVQHEIDHLNGILFFDRIDPDNPLALPDGIKVI